MNRGSTGDGHGRQLGARAELAHGELDHEALAPSGRTSDRSPWRYSPQGNAPHRARAPYAGMASQPRGIPADSEMAEGAPLRK